MTIIAATAGTQLARMLSPRALNRISATLLTVIGVVIIISALQTA